MILHQLSHTDHIPSEVLKWALNQFRYKQVFFAETVELPEDLPMVQCGLHGPVMGDGPVTDGEVLNQARAGREWPSRLVDRPTRPTRQVTVIGGPYESHACVLYTIFGGPLSPKEPQDPSLDPERQEESRKFWSEHALSV